MAYNNYYKGNNRGYNQNNRPKTINDDFYNPYSFVPFADHVFELTDEEKVELEFVQDVPVAGSLSGKIRVDFESVTPFCVKCSNGDNPMNVDGQYFVPGSTIKGMVRSVFDIMAYSNARNGIANNRYSMRDLRSSDYELKGNDSKQVAGFLVKIKGEYYIQPCSNWHKLSYEQISGIINESETLYEDYRELQEKKDIKSKYDLVKNRMTVYSGVQSMWFFSEAMLNRKNPEKSKWHEFLFEIPKFKKEELMKLSNEVLDDFIFIHEKENENKSWKYWKDKVINKSHYSSIDDFLKSDDCNEKIVPCFFRLNEKGDAVKDLGFSYLYRQPYDKKIHDFLPEAHKESAIDLAQAVFGYAGKGKSLKGRVQFGAAFIKNPKILGRQIFKMGSPKPTYYPFYLEQDNIGKLRTYFTGTRLSGAKRYLLHETVTVGNEKDSKVTSSFCPIDKGCKFSSFVYFHNLHDYELGALLAAITFCGRTECHHSMGYAKAFGYGRIKVNDCQIEMCEENDKTKLMNTFISKLTERCGISMAEWAESIRALFIIAKGEYCNKEIRYPNMDNKEFETIKNTKKKIIKLYPHKFELRYMFYHQHNIIDEQGLCSVL